DFDGRLAGSWSGREPGRHLCGPGQASGAELESPRPGSHHGGDVLAQHRWTGPGHEQGRRVSRPRGALARAHQATGIEPGKAGSARGAWCAPSQRSHCRCGPEPLWRYLAFDAPDHLRDTVKTNRDRLRAPTGLTQTVAPKALDTERGVCYYNSCRQAEVAELADALRSGRSGLHARVGSNPSFGTRHTENRSTERFFAFRGAVAQQRKPAVRRVFCLFAPGLPLRYSFQRTLRKYRIAADMPWQLGNSRATVAAPSPTRTIISAMRDKLVVK